MSYSPTSIECIRFAARKGGVGIGCCAVDLLQGFVNDPDGKAHHPLRYGDSLQPITDGGEVLCFGPTNKDIFLGYLKHGTFDTREMPDRIFLAVITDEQCRSVVGQKWLTIFKEEGFEFVRGTHNSVYGAGRHMNYLFGLFRNLGKNDSFAPPDFWQGLPEPTRTPREMYDAITVKPQRLSVFVTPAPQAVAPTPTPTPFAS